MLLALWLSFKRGKQKVRKIKKRSGDPADWDPNHPVQQTYEEIIEKNGIPAGWRKSQNSLYRRKSGYFGFPAKPARLQESAK